MEYPASDVLYEYLLAAASNAEDAYVATFEVESSVSAESIKAEFCAYVKIERDVLGIPPMDFKREIRERRVLN